jgi:hypothetical protein
MKSGFKGFAAIVSAFVMLGVLTAAPASACHWKKGYHCSKHHKCYKPHKCYKAHRQHKYCKHW